MPAKNHAQSDGVVVHDSRGDLHIPADLIDVVIEFLLPQELFVIRRVSKALFLTQEAQGKIDQCLFRLCLASGAMIKIQDGPGNQGRMVHQWQIVNYKIPNRPGIPPTPPKLVPLTSLQETALFSTYAVEHYTLADRILLAFAYDICNMNEVLGDGMIHSRRGMYTPNISHSMNSCIYQAHEIARDAFSSGTMPAGSYQGAVSEEYNNLLVDWAKLGVNYRELSHIPALFRKFIALNQLCVSDRKEIDCLIAKENRARLLSGFFLKTVKNIIDMLPYLLPPPGHGMSDSRKKLFKLKISDLHKLYSCNYGRNRLEYLSEWLKQYLINLDITPKDPFDANGSIVFVNRDAYDSIEHDFIAAIRILMSEDLTLEDLEESKKYDFDLQYLQDKIDIKTADQNLPGTKVAVADPMTKNSVLRFTAHPPSLSSNCSSSCDASSSYSTNGCRPR